MNTIKSCNELRQSLVKSGLHYFINESPHSIWITIRKKFLADHKLNTPVEDTGADQYASEELAADYKALEERYLQLENSYDIDIAIALLDIH